jgi:hypothetical protein
MNKIIETPVTDHRFKARKMRAALVGAEYFRLLIVATQGAMVEGDCSNITFQLFQMACANVDKGL